MDAEPVKTAVSKNWQNWVMVGFISFSAMLAALIVGEPDSLGISETAIAWLAIVNVGVVAVANQIKAMGS